MWQYQSVQLILGVPEGEETKNGAEKKIRELGLKLLNSMKDIDSQSSKHLSRINIKKTTSRQMAEM